MMASIEDEAAEAAELMARRGSHSVVRNGHEFERRMSKVSRKSARSSVGGGSNNGSYQGALGTTTAEVIPGVQTSFTHCLKITQNVAVEFLNFGIFHQFLSY